jgi:hypothetical protein
MRRSCGTAAAARPLRENGPVSRTDVTGPGAADHCLRLMDIRDDCEVGRFEEPDEAPTTLAKRLVRVTRRTLLLVREPN